MDVMRILGYHISADFESIERDFANVCKQNPNWNVIDDAEDLDNRFGNYGQPYNNGKATVVNKKNDA